MDKREYLTCKECGQEFQELKNLHLHIRSHDLRQVDYYQKFYPKRDLYDNTFIAYKNRDFYFSNDFNTKKNFKNWLEGQSRIAALNYCTNLLKRRVNEKNLKYSLSQVEAKSINFPPINYFLAKEYDYYGICESIGLKVRLNNFDEFKYGYGFKNPENMIIVDSREQKPLKFSRFNIEVGKLEFGDYTLNNQEICQNIYVERKSLNDFIGTISGGYERFTNEIERAVAANGYLVVVVESSFKNVMNFDKFATFSKMKATPEFIFHRVRELMQKYENIQFLFVESREESARVIEKILTCKGSCKNVDLQLFYDIGRI